MKKRRLETRDLPKVNRRSLADGRLIDVNAGVKGKFSLRREKMDWKIIIIAALVSGLLSVIISDVRYRMHEKYLRKLKTLKDFAANRYDVLGEDFTRALNEIFIVFSDSKKVKQALKKYHEHIVSPARSSALDEQYLIELFKSMCKDIKIKTSDFTDSFFLTAFNVKKQKKDL